MFAVTKSHAGFRPIHNLKPLNQFLTHQHFKMEGFKTLREMIRPNCFFTKLDLSDAYLTVPVRTEHRTFLGFEWKSRFYHWNVLPFGLSLSPWAFTKLLKPVVAFCRKLGIDLIDYLDDFLIFHLNAIILSFQTNLSAIYFQYWGLK
jgi:hypothetical protein